ncbi:undecaprenyl-diphosphate phosphatase [Priestia koreensis]|uniref:undecaprenyl-diphosphate phosphatase n=1 Tax=Priestia koreensis TaxID=284581 RepID=UPI003018A9A3
MIDFLVLVKAFILGLVEGLTEFLPVSSTGHLILADHFLNFRQGVITKQVATTFEVVIQLGSILAVVVVFWKRLWSSVDFRKRNFTHSFNIFHIIIGMVPAGVLGVLFQSDIKDKLFGPQTVVYALIAGGILMLVAELYSRKTVPTTVTMDELSYKQAFAIGLFQCLALWPGFSRSGSTIAGGLFVRASHQIAAEFSFIVAVPIMFGATALDLYKSAEYLSMDLWPVFAVGLVTAFLVALLAIVTFLKLVSRLKLIPFAIYRFVIAIILLFVFL